MALFLVVGVGLAVAALHWQSPDLFSQLEIPFGLRLSHGAETSNVITPQLSTFIEKTLALENITGLSVAVIPKHGQPEFHNWGYRTEDQDEVTPDTLFHMASVSKAFCATALGLLIDDFENGNNVTALPSGVTELTWHTRLRDVLPDWQLMDEWASERANLRDILSHVSGVPRHDASYGPSDTPEDMTRRLRYLPPAFELREHWSYNNIMYMVAAQVIETYSGRPYTSFVEERIFAPLEMTSSTFSPTKAEATGKFTQGWTKEGRRALCFTEEMASVMAGPGGIISNSVDMAKWISTWISKGVYGNRTIIPPSVYQNASYSYSIGTDHPADPEHSIGGYGMGWFRSSYRGYDVVSHTGSVPGLSTSVSFLPSDEIGVTVFANGESKAEPVALISERILDSALHLSSSLIPASSRSKPVVATEPSSEAENSTLSLDALAGTYANPGYGSFTLCAPSSVSSYCADLRSNFTAVDSIQGSPSPSGDLLAEWPRIWSSHVRMRARRGASFEFYLTTPYPNGYGKDETPFERLDVGARERWAEFVVEDGEVVGFGLSGLVGEMTERVRKHASGTVQDRAEVWFDKV